MHDIVGFQNGVRRRKNMAKSNRLKRLELEREALEERRAEARNDWEKFKKEFRASNGIVKCSKSGIVLTKRTK